MLQNACISSSVSSLGLEFITSARMDTADDAITLWYESHNRWVVYFQVNAGHENKNEVLTIAITASLMSPTVPLYTASHIQSRAFSASWLAIFHGFEEEAAYQNTVGMNLCRKRLLSVLPFGRSSFRYRRGFRASSGFGPSCRFKARSTLTRLCRHHSKSVKTVQIVKQKTHITGHTFLPFEGAQLGRFTFGTIQLKFIGKAPTSIVITFFGFFIFKGSDDSFTGGSIRGRQVSQSGGRAPNTGNTGAFQGLDTSGRFNFNCLPPVLNDAGSVLV
jgi:hypothetical protein